MNEFDPTATGWTPANAYWMAKLSELAYDDRTSIGLRCHNTFRLDTVTFVSDADTDTECFVATCPAYSVVCFRGTEPDELSDWLTDIQISKRWLPAIGNVHRGFRNSFHSVGIQITQALGNTHGPVFFTGHSLGGALATIAMAYAPSLIRATTQLYTFGSPRVMDKDAASNFNHVFAGRSFRHVNNSDGVCRIPTRLSGYWHIDESIVADADGVWQRGTDFWTKLIERVKADVMEWIDGRDLAVLNDHRISEYVRVAQKNLPTP